MARKYYETKIKEIRQEYKGGRKDLLVDTVYKMSKQLNQRFYRMEKAGIGLKENAYRYAQQETGKDRPRYSTSKNMIATMPEDLLYEFALDLNKKLVSDTSTIGGVKDLIERRLDKAVEALDVVDAQITKDQLRKFVDAGGSDFLNDKKTLSSDQILMDYKKFVVDGKIGMQEFIDSLRKYQTSTEHDYGAVSRGFAQLNAERLEKEKD